MKDESRGHSLALALCFLIYSGFLFLYIAHLPLWLDESVDVSQTKYSGIVQILEKTPNNLGGVPLGYFAQALSIRILGVSSFSARLPPLLFGLATCILVFLLAKDLGLRYPILAAVLFGLFPIEVRYSLEARLYSCCALSPIRMHGTLGGLG